MFSAHRLKVSAMAVIASKYGCGGWASDTCSLLKPTVEVFLGAEADFEPVDDPGSSSAYSRW